MLNFGGVEVSQTSLKLTYFRLPQNGGQKTRPDYFFPLRAKPGLFLGRHICIYIYTVYNIYIYKFWGG